MRLLSQRSPCLASCANGRRRRAPLHFGVLSPLVGALVLPQHHVGSGGVGGSGQVSAWVAERARSRPQPASRCPGDLSRVAEVGLLAGVRGGSGVAEGGAHSSAG